MTQAKGNIHSRLDEIKSTSAHLAIAHALILYYAIYGGFNQEIYSTQKDVLNQGEQQTFLTNFKAIILNLLSENSAAAVVSAHFTPDTYYQTTHNSWFIGKEKYFDHDDRICLSRKGVDELRKFLNDLKINNEDDQRCLNEFVPKKSRALSFRRAALASSALSAFNTFLMFSFLYPVEGDALLFNQQLQFDNEAVAEDMVPGFLKVVLVYLLSSMLLKSYSRNRSYDVLSQYRRTSIKALERIIGSLVGKDKSAVCNEINIQFNILIFKSAISAENNRQNANKTAVPALIISTIFAFLDGFSLGATLAIRFAIAAVYSFLLFLTRYLSRVQQSKTKLWAKQHRSIIYATFREQLIAELSIYGLDPVNKDANLSVSDVDVRRTVQDDVEKFMSTYIKPLSICISRGEQKEVRSITLTLPNQKQLVFQSKEEFLLKMTSYVRSIISATIENDELEKILKKYKKHDKYFIKECMWQIRTDCLGESACVVDGERQEVFCQYIADYFSAQDGKGIQRLHQYTVLNNVKSARKKDNQIDNTATRSGQSGALPCPRQKWESEDDMTPLLSDQSTTTTETCDTEAGATDDIDQVQPGSAEYRDPRREYFAKTWNYTYYSLSCGVMPWQNNDQVLDRYCEKMGATDDCLAENLPSQEEVLKRMHDDLSWNPLVLMTRTENQVNQDTVKRDLSWTLSYARYAGRHGMRPWENDDAVLNAYYVKRLQSAERKIFRSTQGRDSLFNQSSSELFDKLLASGESSGEQNKLAAENRRNRAGLFGSCLIGIIPSTIISGLYPVFAYMPSGLVGSSAACFLSFGLSFLARYQGQVFRDNAVQEARLAPKQ